MELSSTINIVIGISKGILAFKDKNDMGVASAIWETFTEAVGFKDNKDELEDLFREAISETIEEEKKILEQYTSQDGEVGLEVEDFIGAIKRSDVSFANNELLKMNEEEFTDNLVNHLQKHFWIGGNNLTRDDVESICCNLLCHFRNKLQKKIKDNEHRFNDLIIDYLEENVEITMKTKEELNAFIEDYNLDMPQVINKLDLLIEKVEKLENENKLTFDELLEKIYREHETDDYDNSEIRGLFLGKLTEILERIDQQGEKEFQLLINAILLPFPPPYKKMREINYYEKYDYIKRIIFTLTLISIKFPNLKLKHEIGYPLKITEKHSICYLYTKDKKRVDKAIIDFFTYENSKFSDLSSISKYLVGNSAVFCENKPYGYELDLNSVINCIGEVPSAEGKEYSELDLYADQSVITHCGNCFMLEIKLDETKDDLIKRLNKLLEVK
ncbi:hypothetical protein [Halanaerobium sp. ST460_2HS_T2]|uniref:hypothetical protein n=1 Tax=Halanaerobium sp. ST460_2HS_T2 TaxID=2183914 RepID=UPI000DF2F2A3|nr:hypothetical protein [Halanaerobium sp. ST460_2HS_T2]RCW53382.1 hypothetical protein DFR80_12214 [Halanaerobium sp. ST460_2HS_T2]